MHHVALKTKLLFLALAPEGVNAFLPLLPREPQRETWMCQRSHFLWETSLLGRELREGSQIKSQGRLSQRLCSHLSSSH